MKNPISSTELQHVLLNHMKPKPGQKWKELTKLVQNAPIINSLNSSSPGTPNFNQIKSTGETAFQRAIYPEKIMLQESNHPDRFIRWSEIEIPVELNKNARRKCVDLVGLMDGKPVLCELKYMQSTSSDNPEYAMIELLVYYYLLLLNYKNLDDEKVYHTKLTNAFNWEELFQLAPFTMLVVANKKYWDYWGTNQNQKNFIQTANELYRGTNLPFMLIETPNENFITQRAGKENYKPILENKIWKVIA